MAKYVFLYNGKSWFLQIDSLDVLNTYMDMIWNIRKEDLLDDIKRQREEKHPASDMLDICHVLASVKETDVLHEFVELRKKQHHDMTDMLLSGKTLYVNASGGYCISLDNVVNRYESDDLQWPVFSEDDIRIKKWPGGTHYYAYIGPVEVRDKGHMKWDSESDARLAAMAYVNKMKKLK